MKSDEYELPKDAITKPTCTCKFGFGGEHHIDYFVISKIDSDKNVKVKLFKGKNMISELDLDFFGFKMLSRHIEWTIDTFDKFVKEELDNDNKY